MCMPGYVQKQKTFGTIQVYAASSFKECKQISSYHSHVHYHVQFQILSSFTCMLYVFIIFMMDWWNIL